MAWQEIIALSIVAATAGVFAWNGTRARKKGFGSLCGCGECAIDTTQRPPSIIFQARKGETPRMVVKLH